ncbi:mandelate racemase/muconate lactonizing enzyme family protein [Castellaniella sp.]|uniref:mandelate racemase/muconate lactonizing enzyme family protein n=1 Tax=Castellaniella sp. TaxID=1955812 RepID=UPI002AFFD77B|nr:mandelate racemase/muconate lactonizing enzyme family protein [Castellaniella sp.]
MKITRIDVYRIALPFSARRTAPDTAANRALDPFNAASPALKHMESLMVRLQTDTGLSGWGEAFGHYINPVTFEAMKGRVGHFFLGSEICTDDQGYPTRTAEAEHAFYEFGATGPITFALSAFDTALWDLLAQDRGLPLYQLLGASQDTIDCYASLPSYANDPSEVARQVSGARAQGFAAVKLHETSPAAVVAARSALPDTAALMVDVNCAWTTPQAQAALSDMRAARLRWIEEPVWPPNDLSGLSTCRSTGIPVAAGENAAGLLDLIRHIEAGAIDIAQPSLAKIGGITAMLQAIAAARRHQVEVMPHCFYYGAGLCATAHIVAALGPACALEAPLLDWPAPLHPLQQAAPALTLPHQPGIGFSPNWDVLESHLIDTATLTT